MTENARKAAETRRKNREKWEAKQAAARELRQLQREALRRVLSDENASPTEIVKAAELLAQMDK